METALVAAQYSEAVSLFTPLHAWVPVSEWASVDWVGEDHANNGGSLPAGPRRQLLPTAFLRSALQNVIFGGRAVPEEKKEHK